MIYFAKLRIGAIKFTRREPTMSCMILALALTAQFSFDPYNRAVIGDTVIVTGPYPYVHGSSIIPGFSTPNLVGSNATDVTVQRGQLAKVTNKFSLGENSYVTLQLPNGKTFTNYDNWMVKVKDVVLAKKIFAELADPAAKKAATRKVAATINAKRRQAIAKKYKLDEVTFFLIEAAGKSNGW